MCEGTLTIKYGPMFSGKTTELVKDVGSIVSTHNDTAIAIINSKMDTREEINRTTNLTTHSTFIKDFRENDSCKILYFKLEKIEEIFPYIRENNKIRYLFIDESQFYSDLETEVKKLVDLGLHVYCYGLISDYNMENFGNLKQLFSYADEIKQLYAVCKQCIAEGNKKENSKAMFTMLRQQDVRTEEGQILIGFSDKYESTCRYHHRKV